jgi:hypothetical protein
VRPSLTIALLLIASFGAQGADANQCPGDNIAPRLLAALLDQPAGMLATSQLLLAPAGQLMGQFGAAPCCSTPSGALPDRPVNPATRAADAELRLPGAPHNPPPPTRGP